MRYSREKHPSTIQESKVILPIPESTHENSNPLIDLGEQTIPSPFHSPLYPQSALSSVSPSSTVYTNFGGSLKAGAATPLTPFDFSKPFSPAASTPGSYFPWDIQEYLPTPVSSAPRYRPPTRASDRAENLRQKSWPALSPPRLAINTSVNDKEIPAVSLETRISPTISRKPVRSFTTPFETEEWITEGESFRPWVPIETKSPVSPRRWKNLFRRGKVSPKTPSPESHDRTTYWLNNARNLSDGEMAGSPSPSTDPHVDRLGGRVKDD